MIKDVMFTHWLTAVALALLAFSVGSPAASFTASDADRLSAQRKSFEEAERALKRGDRVRYRELLGKLEGYPLYPYLVYDELRQRMARADATEIERFLDSYADTPLAPRLRRAWLKNAYRDQRWQEVLQAYQPTSNAAMRCRYLRALTKPVKWRRPSHRSKTCGW